MWYKQAKHPYTQSNKIIFLKKSGRLKIREGGKKKEKQATTLISKNRVLVLQNTITFKKKKQTFSFLLFLLFF